MSVVAPQRDALSVFGPATATWFSRVFEGPTEVQRRGWVQIAAGAHALLLAPTGSGKTLAAFLYCLDRLAQRAPDDRKGTRVLYVSPLKALAYDVERNLRSPLVGIERAAKQLGITLTPPRVAIRSGDTSQKERRQQAKDPSEIVVTTPESLYLLLGSQARENLRTVEWVILDEVHALAPTKRGVHLALSLERLADLAASDPQRIGLSATATPVAEVARYLGGDREVAIVDTTQPPALDLQVVVPVPDMTKPDQQRLDPAGDDDEDVPPPSGPQVVQDMVTPPAEADQPEFDDDDDFAPPEMDDLFFDGSGEDAPAMGKAAPEELFGSEGEPKQHGIWPVVVPELIDLIQSHQTTIVFVNSRGLCERLVQRIAEASEDEGLVRAHHGSLSQTHRRETEEMLKTGRIKGIIATSSLELGIDMGAVDLVIMVESPGSVARGLQRIGRAGHGVGQTSKGRLFPKHRGDLLEATVIARRMRFGELEPICIPHNPLDVLAQQVVAMCALEAQPLAHVERVLRRSASFHDLPHDAFVAVLDMLTGRYPSTDFSDLRPRLNWDRDADELSPRKGTRSLAIVNGGTIPDRGMYSVHLASPDGIRVGELDEEMVHETQPGHVITLGATSWRIDEVTRDRVMVTPAPGEVGRMPYWRGEGPGRPIELGRAMGGFLRRLAKKSKEEAEAELVGEYLLHPLSAENLLRYLEEQREATGALPTDRAITVERFRDELGDYRVCILSPFGARVHAPWALALEAKLTAEESEMEVQCMWSDDGICVRIADADELPDIPALFPQPEEVEELVVNQLGNSALFSSHFRENAARSLLLPRRRPGSRTPLWQQRLKSQQLLKVARSYPSFPIVVETYRECLQDVFDLPSLRELLGDIRSRKIRIHDCETSVASPFARSLVFAFVAAYLYEGDAPLAERRAQALALDRNLLRELLGEEELRSLLDPEVIVALERELQHLADDRKMQHVDGLHDLLRRLGALTDEEVAARCEGPTETWLAELEKGRRAVLVGIGEARMWVAVEDVALYRDALGAMPPMGLPRAFLEPALNPLEELVSRWARTHGPFTAEAFAARHGLSAAAVTPVLRLLEGQGRVTPGAFSSTGDREWCDLDVLRRIKRRTLARLRGEVEPVDRATFARFLPSWHGLDDPRRGQVRLEETILQLEGMPLSYAELERSVLPARVAEFSPRMLDDLGAMGEVVWVGHGSLGASDGKVALYRRTQISKLLDPPEVDLEGQSDIERALMERLTQRGACFFKELQMACRGLEARLEEIVAALWDLVWKGLVTNDTFQPLRALGLRKAKRSRRRGNVDLRVAGRWSRVADLLDEVSVTERLHARAVMLLERHGIVSREAATMESLPGGFSSVYPVLKQMEDSGKVRRGYFVDGIGGAQFAFAGAVDRLRGFREPRTEPLALVVSSPDPANPYGWVLPWPDQPAEVTRTPRRVSGALLVLVDGTPALYLERGGKVLLTFDGVEGPALERGFDALHDHLAQYSRKTIHIEQIDDQPALRSPHAPLLKEIGLSFDHRGLIIERRLS
ncbi:MAG: DEAD/DEAH box helicase [Myxococcota bacterium]